MITTKELVGKAIGTIENFFNRKGTLSGVGTGFPDMDRMTDGLHPAEMIVDRGASEHGQNVAGHEHRRACRGGRKTPGGGVQPGNVRRIARSAHDVLRWRA